MSEAGQTLAAARLREGAEAAAAGLPPLRAAAERLAASVQFGLHGRRRAGQGDEFWQYRAAAPHDEARRIDWRRSGRSDQAFVREREWQAAQSVHLWVDRSAGMGFRSGDGLSAKGERAAVLGLAAAILLERAGERVGTADGRLPPRPGRAQLGRLADALGLGEDAGDELLGPDAGAILAGSRAIFLSDFLGGFAAVGQEVRAAAANGVRGVMVQVLDPAEEEFPFAGRTLFESMAGSLSHETREAGGLRRRYLERLAARRDALRALADETGWLAGLHRTDQPPAPALLWIHEGLRART